MIKRKLALMMLVLGAAAPMVALGQDIFETLNQPNGMSQSCGTALRSTVSQRTWALCQGFAAMVHHHGFNLGASAPRQVVATSLQAASMPIVITKSIDDYSPSNLATLPNSKIRILRKKGRA